MRVLSVQVEKGLEDASASLFDQGVQELLRLLADNIYNDYKRLAAAAAASKETSKETEGPPAAPEPKASGCCILM